MNYYRSLNTNVFTCFIDIKGAFDRVNYVKLFRKLKQRGTPGYLIRLLYHWYRRQKLFIKWGSCTSIGFGMTNGIRQGSKLSPCLFNVFIDELNYELSNSKVGCHIAGMPANNFGYADDLALIAPSVKALNKLLSICDEFAKRNDVLYSTEKSVCMMIHVGLQPRFNPPAVFLSGAPLRFVSCYRYLGHIIASNLKDDQDIEREVKSLNVRGNAMIRKFGFIPIDVKCNLFRT